MQGGLQCGQSVVLEHVQERRLACVVEAEEEDLGVLVDQPEAGEDVPEPVDKEHAELNSHLLSNLFLLLRVST